MSSVALVYCFRLVILMIALQTNRELRVKWKYWQTFLLLNLTTVPQSQCRRNQTNARNKQGGHIKSKGGNRREDLLLVAWIVVPSCQLQDSEWGELAKKRLMNPLTASKWSVSPSPSPFVFLSVCLRVSVGPQWSRAPGRPRLSDQHLWRGVLCSTHAPRLVCSHSRADPSLFI